MTTAHKCPECGFTILAGSVCGYCRPQEVKHRKRKTQARKVEGPTGEDMPSPAGSISTPIPIVRHAMPSSTASANAPTAAIKSINGFIRRNT